MVKRDPVCMLKSLIYDLQVLKNSEKILVFKRFFKTGKGEYGEGDQFIGLTVPQQREVVKKYWQTTTIADLTTLLHNPIHEYRLTALLIAVAQYKKYKKELAKRKRLVDWYLKNTKYINNWDLVDLSAPNILGDWFFERSKIVLYNFANSELLWERRIAILTTYEFMRRGKLEDTIRIATILLRDKHDLIHKAVGWMLRELGKRNLKMEESFLKQHYQVMPRTMLRYAIEKFSESKRKKYLRKK